MKKAIRISISDDFKGFHFLKNFRIISPAKIEI